MSDFDAKAIYRVVRGDPMHRAGYSQGWYFNNLAGEPTGPFGSQPIARRTEERERTNHSPLGAGSRDDAGASRCRPLAAQ